MSQDSEDPKDFVDRLGLECKTYVIRSDARRHAPAVLRYLLHLYKIGHENEREDAVKVLRSLNADLPDDVIRAVLSGRLPYDEEGDKVTVKHANF